jgi:GWxTD domain-containing protein
MNKKIFKIFLLLLLFSFTTMLSGNSGKEADKLYQSAKKERIERNWEKAISLYQELIDRFPESNYSDDASFWIGYCLEHKVGQHLEAFLAYNKLINDFPESPWIEDARVHKIFVAESLAVYDKTAYLDFLAEELDSEYPEVSDRAALSLGKLGDERAISYLEKLLPDEKYGLLAKSLILEIESRDSLEEIEPEKVESGITFEATPEIRREQLKEKDDKWGFILPPSKNYKYYRIMLREDNKWSREKLIDFGMWTILSDDEFEEYYNFTGYDRSEWLRKYWKKLDPTPTTENNEARKEFERRVLHARAQFGQLWNYKNFNYLTDQHNRMGWPNAPWDARGELYVKYGKPDFKSATDFNEEEWIYYQLGVDFIVRKYITNIYGRALAAGEISRNRYIDDLLRFQSEYEYSKEFIYKHDYEADPLDNAEVNINTFKENGKDYFIIEYSFSSKELSPPDEHSTVRFLEKWIVLDEHMNPYRKGEETREYVISAHIEMSNTIKVDIRPGDFLIALRLEDTNSNKLGIFIEKMELNN